MYTQAPLSSLMLLCVVPCFEPVFTGVWFTPVPGLVSHVVFHCTLHIHTVCIGYTMRHRSMIDLHNRGPKAQGFVNQLLTVLPRDITDFYHV